MRKLAFIVFMLGASLYASACTNLIVGKKASIDGSVMCTYSADSYGMFLNLTHFPAAKHPKGTMRRIVDRDTNKYWGDIPEADETYNVIGNINEYQLTIGETTFGGRHEMVDTTGMLDYTSLMDLGLQRAKTAREAIKVMTTLAETYGYNSEGETFSICDPNEAWIMEMMGCGPGSKQVVWVALRIPDDAICAHANQSRITTFNQKDKDNVMCSKNVVKYAKKMGWYDGKDADFNFRDTYAAPDFGGRRYCEARVWALFNRFVSGMDRYLPFVEGKEPLKDTESMPLWVVPAIQLTLHDVQMAMRDHYEGTPFALDSDMGGGIWDMPYRPTPLSYKVDGKSYFNERPVSTQQAAFVWVSQMRSWLPRQLGGILWFANDDANMAPFTPVYCGNTVQPKPYNTPGADDLNFSKDNAFWVCNWVSNMVYPRYNVMFPSLEAVRDSLERSYIAAQVPVEKMALGYLKNHGEEKMVDYLNSYSCLKADQMISRWRRLATYLIVKFNDMAVKPEKDGRFQKTEYGYGATVKRPGFPEKYARKLVRETGDKFEVPAE